MFSLYFHDDKVLRKNKKVIQLNNKKFIISEENYADEVKWVQTLCYHAFVYDPLKKKQTLSLLQSERGKTWERKTFVGENLREQLWKLRH